ncbi:dolichol kinase [Halospeciosus flavus]|uniref:dolichol kinase n=1 Tax=Halospeciosus flavus TaxID=3032283 RepID=UPI003605DA30
MHLSGSAAPLTYLFGVLTWREVSLILLGLTLLVGVLETLRLKGHIDWWIYDKLTREYEEDDVAGYVLYVVGMTATAWLFDPAVAAPAMLMLTVGDPISGYLSSADLGEKEWWVMAVTFGVCLAITVLLGVPVLAGVLGAAAATVADARTPIVAGYVVDDNLTIPLCAGTVMWLVVALL